MAVNFGKDKDTLFASSDLMSFGKAFSRMAAQPLDKDEVWYDYDALVAYALATDKSSYVGQKVVYIDEANEKVYQYSIEFDGSLKEIGTAPIGDTKSIVVAENGTVSLKGIDSLVFTDDEGNEVNFQPLMTKDGLVWVQPSKTTVEGLASLIDGLTQRVGALETSVGKAAEGENAATGLHKAIADEIARADAAEKALGKRIDEIDFVDNNELTEAIKDFETKENVKKVADDLSAYVESNDEALAAVKATADAAATNDALVALEEKVDAFLTGDGATDALDSLKELIEYINEHDDVEISTILGDIEAIQGKLVGIDTTVTAYVTAAIDALKIGDYAKAADLTELAGKVEVLEGKVDVAKVSEAIATAKGEAISDAEGKIATAKSEAIADADAKLLLKANVADVYTKSQTYSQDEIDELLENIQAGSSESAASVKTQLDAYKKIVNNEVWGNEEGSGDSRIDFLEANKINSVSAKEGAKLVVSTTNKNVEIDDSALVTLIGNAQSKAEEGVANAATAQSKANSAYSLAEENKGALTTLSTTVSDNKAAQDLIAGRVSTLESTDTDHGSRISKLESDILTKATTESVNAINEALVGRISPLETDNTNNKAAISTLQGTVNGHSARFAGMTETDTVVSLVNEAKGLANTAQGAADEAKGLVSALETGKVKANADAIAALDIRVTAIDKANDGKLAVIESNISGIDARVTALDKEGGRVALIEGRVSTVESDVSTLKGQITGLTGAMHWRGEVESLEGLTGYVSGDVVSVKGSAQEYIFDGENWKLFGDEGSYALKDNVYTKSEVYTKTETDGLLTALTTAHEGLISAAEGRAAEDATSKANTAEANAKAYVDAAMSWTDME